MPYQAVYNWQNQTIAGDLTYTVALTGGIQYTIYFDFASFIGDSQMDLYVNGTRKIQNINPYKMAGNQNHVGVQEIITIYPVNNTFNFYFNPTIGSSKAFINSIYIIPNTAGTTTSTITKTFTFTPTFTPTFTKSPTITNTPTITPTYTPAIYNYYIDCGSTNTYSLNGISWVIDKSYAGTSNDYGYNSCCTHNFISTTYTTQTITPYNTIYQTYAKNPNNLGTIEYDFNIPFGYYMISFSWVDWISVAEGQNVQSIEINGAWISGLQNLDIYKIAKNGKLYQQVVFINYTSSAPFTIILDANRGVPFLNALCLNKIDPQIIYIKHIRLNTAYPPYIQF